MKIVGFIYKYRLDIIFMAAVSISCATMLAGCTAPIVKKDDPPSANEAVSWMPKNFTEGKLEVGLPRPKEKWWEDFGSSELNKLVETALKNNYDLRIAVSRVAQARAQARVVRAGELPTVDLITGYQNQAPYPSIGSAANTSQWYSKEVWQAGLAVNYEVDVWGRKGFDTESAYAQALASDFNRQAVALSLVGDVVQAYFDVVALNERISVGDRNLGAIRTVSKGLDRRITLGDSTLIDYSQQVILENNTDATITNLRNQRARTFNRLALLTGQPPTALSIAAKSIEHLRPVVVQPGLPSDLLCRRPDIRRAEAMLESSKADLYSARANILPKFALTGQGGYGSFLLSTITQPQSLFFNIGANIVTNIFDGGKRDAQVDVASAKNMEMVESYANTVLSALRDVEDSLSDVALSARAYSSLNEARERAQKLTVMSARLVELGGLDYVQLYEIQRTVFATEDAAIAARNQQLIASVNLFKSIGGGIKAEKDPCLGGTDLPDPTQAWKEKVAKAESAEKTIQSPIANTNPVINQTTYP